jgi:hypothetical protein
MGGSIQWLQSIPNELVQLQIGNRLLEPGILLLQLLEAFGLVELQATVLATPPVVRLLADPDAAADQA